MTKNEFKQRDSLYYFKQRIKTSLIIGLSVAVLILIFYLLNLVFKFVEM